MDIAKAMKKYKANAGAAGQAYKEGIQNTSVDPMQKAAAAAPKWEAGVQKAMANNSFAKGCQKTSKADWQAAAAGKGSTNYTNGIGPGADKWQRKMTALKPDLDRIEAEINGMPDTTEAERDAKVLRNIQLRRELKGRA